ncbi:hypothetical protein ACQ86N_42845 [Puia sp. P3]|uniref:hypothetical protein n=1 Tax=Puia sp. P3 TaxID=3423952 RepID=UPI003D67B4F4
MLPAAASAQSDSTTVRKTADSTRRHSYFEIGVNYQSDNVYLGRRDSVALPLYHPSSHLYASFGTLSDCFCRMARQHGSQPHRPHYPGPRIFPEKRTLYRRLLVLEIFL